MELWRCSGCRRDLPEDAFEVPPLCDQCRADLVPKDLHHIIVNTWKAKYERLRRQVRKETGIDVEAFMNRNTPVRRPEHPAPDTEYWKARALRAEDELGQLTHTVML